MDEAALVEAPVVEAPSPVVPSPVVVDAPVVEVPSPVVVEAPAPVAPVPVAPSPVVPSPVVVEVPAPVAPAPVAPAPVAPAPVAPAPVAPAPVAPAPVIPAPVAPAPVIPAPVSTTPPIIASPVTLALPDINLAPIFNSIVTDITFISNIKAAVGRIMKDGAVNESDIPDIILVILETVNLMKSVRVTSDQLSALIKMLFHYTMDSYNLIVADKKAAFDKLLEYSVHLFLLKPTMNEVTTAVSNVVNEVQEVHLAARRLFPCCS